MGRYGAYFFVVVVVVVVGISIRQPHASYSLCCNSVLFVFLFYDVMSIML